MREGADSRVFPAVFELFSCASFHLIVKTEKNTKTQAIRALKEESHDMAIFDLAFDVT